MFYRHGWHSWSPTRWVDPTVPPVPVTDEVRRHNQYHPVHPFDTSHGSHGVTALERGEGTVDLIGSLGGGGVVLVEDGEVSVEGPHDWFTCSAAEDDAFAAYADALGDALGRRGGTGPNVWCSWYSHFTDVTERDIVDALVHRHVPIAAIIVNFYEGCGETIAMTPEEIGKRLPGDVRVFAVPHGAADGHREIEKIASAL